MTLETRNATIERWEAALKEWSAKIEVLDAKARRLKADLKEEAQTQVTSLRSKEHALAEQLAKAKASGEEAWDDVRSGLNDAWSDLKDAIERASTKMS
jgi:SMC interacting uncharacterized protein involved in chromosome segregation